jgi:hypothetical protein
MMAIQPLHVQARNDQIDVVVELLKHDKVNANHQNQ